LQRTKQRTKDRKAQINRQTTETKVVAKLNIDGRGKASIDTGIPFLDHMVTLFARHAVIDLNLRCRGDLQVDAHHTVEDCGIVLGQAFQKALDDKKGIRRYGFAHENAPPKGRTPNLKGEAYVPMDECLARCVIDFSGRPYLVWRGLDKLALKQAREFFQGFTNEARCNLHLELLYGEEPHHVVEALFKSFAKAVDLACQRDPRISGKLPSTKELL
jgi:imidazoleglycerol-phosphate dehydratase